MARPEKTPTAETGKPSQVFCTSLPNDVAGEVSKDAQAEAQAGERPNESRVLRRIVCTHYAPRLAKQGRQMKRAA